MTHLTALNALGLILSIFSGSLLLVLFSMMFADLDERNKWSFTVLALVLLLGLLALNFK